jgi:deoxyribodipyrimidine photo-lyase
MPASHDNDKVFSASATPNLIWVHEDALRLEHPVFDAAGEEARAVFIWDEADLKRRGHSFNKLVFIYECLQDMGVTIEKGETSAVLRKLMASHQALFFAKTFNPELRSLITPLEGEITMIEVAPERLGDVEITPEMARFFRFWNKAKKSILKASTDA